MERLISEQINFAPILDTITTSQQSSVNDKRLNRMYKVLRLNNWVEELNWITYDNQISTGDQFFEIYFLEDDPIPRLRSLDSKKMTDIVIDEETGIILAYVYKETVVDKYINMSASSAFVNQRSSRTVTTIFERGKTTRIDPLNVLKTDEGETIYEKNKNNQFILDEKGNKIPRVKPTIRENQSNLIDEFMLIHIPSIKRQEEGFSEIIASRIIDNCLKMDQITTDYRYTNKLAGFPVSAIIDGVLEKELSSRSPGGFLTITSTAEADGKQAKLQVIEISNDLKSLENEMAITEIDLYRKMYLFRPDVEIEAAKSDSSLVQQQLRLSLEKFLRLLVVNINNSFKKLFAIAQKSYGYKNIINFEFKIPEPIIESSLQQKTLQEIQELNSGIKTLKDIWRDRGLNDKQIQKKWNEHIEQFYEKNKDVSFVKSNNNIPNLDNNFKKQ